MTRSLIVALAGCTILVNACVGSLTPQERLAELQESRENATAHTAEIAALEQERTRLLEELSAARTGREKALSDLALNRHFLENERQILNQAESRLLELQNDSQHVDRERDLLQEKVERLTVQLEQAREDLTGSQQSLKDAYRRIKDLEQEAEQTKAALAKAREKARGLEAAVAADHESWTRLRKALSTVEEIDTRSGEPAGQVIQP